jgi:hypothetical protein
MQKLEIPCVGPGSGVWVDLYGFFGQEKGFFGVAFVEEAGHWRKCGAWFWKRCFRKCVKGSVVEQKKMILCVCGLPFELLAEALVAGAELVFLQEPQSVD